MKRLICLGDSITDAGRLFSPDGLGYGYVSRLDRLLNDTKQYYQIINRGFDGFTTDRVAVNAGRDCIDLRPDVVTILVGINDIGLMMNTDRTSSQQKAMLAESGRSYRALLEQIRRYTDCTLILMEPFIFPWPREYAGWVPFVKNISEQIQRLSEEYSCPYVLLHDKLNKAAEAEGFDSITEDGIHLTPRGHELLAKELYPLIPQ